MRKIMKYPALFVFSVALSIIIWLVVNNANDPVVSYRATNVPVRITHKEVLTANNKVYQVLDDTDVIDTVTIRAPRSIIDALDDENIIATADMNEISDDGTIPIFLTTNKYASDLDSITGSISQVELLVENKKTKVVRLKCTTSGEVSEGYMVGDITPEQNQVRLSGGESAIDSVSYAAIDVNVTGFTADINTLADIKLCDEEGETVDSTGITMNVSAVRAKVEILALKDVPVKATYTGTPAEGYSAHGAVVSDPATVQVAGKSSIVSSMTAIDIPGSVLDVTGATSNVSKVVDLDDYLMNGVEVVDNGHGSSATLTVEVSAVAAKEIGLSYNAIQITGVPAGYTASISLPEDHDGNAIENYKVNVLGFEEDISKVTAEDISAYADLTEVSAAQGGPGKGSFTGVPVTFKLSEGNENVMVSGNVNITVGLTAEE